MEKATHSCIYVSTGSGIDIPATNDGLAWTTASMNIRRGVNCTRILDRGGIKLPSVYVCSNALVLYRFHQSIYTDL